MGREWGTLGRVVHEAMFVAKADSLLDPVGRDDGFRENRVCIGVVGGFHSRTESQGGIDRVVFLDAEWGRWRNLDGGLQEASESLEGFDDFGTGGGFHSAEGPVPERAEGAVVDD